MSRKEKILIFGGLFLAAVLVWLLSREAKVSGGVNVEVEPQDNFTGNVPTLAFPGVSIPPLMFPDRTGSYNPANFPAIPSAPNIEKGACCDKCAGAGQAVFTVGMLTSLVGAQMGDSAQRQMQQLWAGLQPPGVGWGFASGNPF